MTQSCGPQMCEKQDLHLQLHHPVWTQPGLSSEVTAGHGFVHASNIKPLHAEQKCFDSLT